MRTILEKGVIAVMLAVISSFCASVGLFIYSTYKMAVTLYHMFHDIGGESGETTVHIVATLDSFLLAVILYIFSVALYELFIGEMKLPEWLIIKNLDDLKKKLSSVIALMLAVQFLEHLVQWTDPQATLMFAIAIAIVIFALIFYIRTKEKDGH